jgi:carboxylate-amine ligase
MSTKALLYELLDFIDPVLDHLGSRHRVAYVNKMIENGTGADRQLAVYEQTKNLVSVVDYIRDNFLTGV